MTTYVPLRSRPIVAVRLTRDLRLSKGDWVGVDPEDSRLVTLSHEVFVATYGLPDETVAETKEERAPRRHSSSLLVVKKSDAAKPTTRCGRTLNSCLTTQAGRFFYLLRRHAHPMTAAQLAPFVSPPDKPKSISAALAVLRELGVVASSRVSRDVFWSTTDYGRSEFDRLGPRCFTDYGLPLPPDLTSSAAERLAAAWKDRHSE